MTDTNKALPKQAERNAAGFGPRDIVRIAERQAQRNREVQNRVFALWRQVQQTRSS